MKTSIVENKKVTINDKVNFKLDTEQSGIIKDIKNGDILVVEGKFSGILRKDKTFEVNASRCWLDSKYKTVLEKEVLEKNNSKVYAIVEKEKVFIGDVVNFKCDVEQYGKIKEIKKVGSDYELTIEATSEDGFDGDYIGGDLRTTMNASECWLS